MFMPKAHLQWHMQSTQIYAHFCELPHACFIADQIFRFFDALGLHVPVAWASMHLQFREPGTFMVYENLQMQFQILDAILNDLAVALNQDWINRLRDSTLTHILRFADDYRRSILLGLAVSLWGPFPQEAPHRSAFRWTGARWPRTLQPTVRCLRLNVYRLRKAGGFAPDAGPPLASARRYAERDKFRSFLFDIWSFWTWQLDDLIDGPTKVRNFTF